MGVLDNLEPKEVFHFFEEITKIPRPSYHEKAISDYLVNFAKERGLEYYQDKLYNVIIIKEASEGYEDQEPIILQGHMDMVCEKNPGVDKDMEKEGLDLEIDGDYIRAKGTTLGGDDGIAVAYALALLDSKTLKHPRLEFVCTVSEEVGMDGAHAIDLSPLKGHLLLNMDSEDEGIVLAGCAGGGCANVTLDLQRETCSWDRMLIHIDHLTGGHSGAEINKGRASSVSLAGRVLRDLSSEVKVRLVSMINGSKDNAISRECRMVVAVSDPEKAKKRLAETESAVRSEYHIADPDITITAEEAADIIDVHKDANPLSKKSTKRIITLLTALPQGIQRMSDNVKGLVESSLNWGVAEITLKNFSMRAAVRSSVSTAKDDMFSRIRCIAKSCYAELKITGEYPAWEWVEKSALRDRMARIYREMFGKDLVIEAIHAGVECGLLADKIPHMDAISMGPNILYIHTPNEHLSISSTERMWRFIVAIIEDKS